MCVANDLSNNATCMIDDTSPSSVVAFPDHSDSEEQNDYDNNNVSSNRTEETKEVSWRGCRNLGNSCYFNSAIQMLASVFDFSETLEKHIKHKSDCDKNKQDEAKTLTSSLEGTLSHTLKELLQTNNNSSIDMTALKSEVDELSPFFLGYEQQDAHEFLMSLLQLLQDQLFPDQSYHNGTSSDSESILSSKHFRKSKLKHGDHDGDSSNGVHDTDASPIHKVNSFSRLNLEAINHLLHNEVDQNHTMHKSYSTSNLNTSSKISSLFVATNKTSKKLVGGRAGSKEIKRLQMVPQSLPIADVTNDDCRNDVRGNFAVLAGSPNHPLESALSASRTHADDEYGESEKADSLNTINQNTKDSSKRARPDQIPINQSPKSTFMDDFFSVDIQTRITCSSCKYTRTRTETNTRHITLTLNSYTDSIQDAMRYYFAPQTCQLKCERCFTDGATQSMHIAKLPKNLLLHISRFTCSPTTSNSNNAATFAYTKNSSSISYPRTLSYYRKKYNTEPSFSPSHILNEFTTPDIQLPSSSSKQYNYQLCSVVNHIGSSAEYGHYTVDAIRQNKFETSNGNKKTEWFRFNDEIVSPLKPEDALRNETTAYLLMYSLKDI